MDTLHAKKTALTNPELQAILRFKERVKMDQNSEGPAFFLALTMRNWKLFATNFILIKILKLVQERPNSAVDVAFNYHKLFRFLQTENAFDVFSFVGG